MISPDRLRLSTPHNFLERFKNGVKRHIETEDIDKARKLHGSQIQMIPGKVYSMEETVKRKRGLRINDNRIIYVFPTVTTTISTDVRNGVRHIHSR
jgi:hypothetical protein